MSMPAQYFLTVVHVVILLQIDKCQCQLNAFWLLFTCHSSPDWQMSMSTQCILTVVHVVIFWIFMLKLRKEKLDDIENKLSFQIGHFLDMNAFAFWMMIKESFILRWTHFFNTLMLRCEEILCWMSRRLWWLKWNNSWRMMLESEISLVFV